MIYTLLKIKIIIYILLKFYLKIIKLFENQKINFKLEI